jgi:hypothetical protein
MKAIVRIAGRTLQTGRTQTARSAERCVRVVAEASVLPRAGRRLLERPNAMLARGCGTAESVIAVAPERRAVDAGVLSRSLFGRSHPAVTGTPLSSLASLTPSTFWIRSLPPAQPAPRRSASLLSGRDQRGSRVPDETRGPRCPLMCESDLRPGESERLNLGIESRWLPVNPRTQQRFELAQALIGSNDLPEAIRARGPEPQKNRQQISRLEHQRPRALPPVQDRSHLRSDREQAESHEASIRTQESTGAKAYAGQRERPPSRPAAQHSPSSAPAPARPGTR